MFGSRPEAVFAVEGFLLAHADAMLKSGISVHEVLSGLLVVFERLAAEITDHPDDEVDAAIAEVARWMPAKVRWAREWNRTSVKPLRPQ